MWLSYAFITWRGLYVAFNGLSEVSLTVKSDIENKQTNKQYNRKARQSTENYLNTLNTLYYFYKIATS